MYNIIYKNILNGKEYVRSKSSAMTLSVGHFKGRYEAWNWKYLMEDTITMTMELELQVDEASVNSQGKFVYLNTIWALESKVIESCYSHSSFFQIMWFVKPQNYPFSFFLQTHPPSIFCSHGWTPPTHSTTNNTSKFNIVTFVCVRSSSLPCCFFLLAFGCSRVLITFLFVVQACWVILVKLFVISSRGETRHPCVIFCLSLIVDHVQLIDERLKTHGRILTILYLIHSF